MRYRAVAEFEKRRQAHRLWLLAVMLLAATPSLLSQNAAGRTGVVTLGTGNPGSDPERFGPATVVVVDDRGYLVDTGVGVMRRVSAVRATRRNGLRLGRMAFITHLHSDHTLGLPEFIFDVWMRDSERKINLYGPKGLQSMVDKLLAAWAEDIRIRLASSDDLSSPPQVEVHEIAPGEIYSDSMVKVTAFAVHHGLWPEAYGYRFDTPEKVVVISGDAGPPSAIPDQCRKCDILVHEGGMPETRATPYYKDSHTTAERLAEIANASRPGLLVLTHQRGGGYVGGLEIIRRKYDGKVVIASDLDVFP